MKKITKAVFGFDHPLPDGKGLNIYCTNISLRRKQLSLIWFGGILP